MHRINYKYVSVRLLTIKSSQWARENFRSYRKIVDTLITRTPRVPSRHKRNACKKFITFFVFCQLYHISHFLPKIFLLIDAWGLLLVLDIQAVLCDVYENKSLLLITLSLYAGVNKRRITGESLDGHLKRVLVNYWCSVGKQITFTMFFSLSS